MKAGVDGVGQTKVLEGVNSGGSGSFGVARDGIYYGSEPPDQEMRFFSFQSGQSRTVLKEKRLSSNGLAVSPAGHWLLYPQVDGQAGSDLMLVENFQ